MCEKKLGRFYIFSELIVYILLRVFMSPIISWILHTTATRLPSERSYQWFIQRGLLCSAETILPSIRNITSTISSLPPGVVHLHAKNIHHFKAYPNWDSKGARAKVKAISALDEKEFWGTYKTMVLLNGRCRPDAILIVKPSETKWEKEMIHDFISSLYKFRKEEAS
jgi:hypothetical protein